MAGQPLIQSYSIKVYGHGRLRTVQVTWWRAQAAASSSTLADPYLPRGKPCQERRVGARLAKGIAEAEDEMRHLEGIIGAATLQNDARPSAHHMPGPISSPGQA